jgi:hypothetical protein
MSVPVIYTPGDNEWTDCRSRGPLDALAGLRRVFFASPGHTLGTPPMAVASQAARPEFAEFPENVRWRYGALVFATVHVVGSSNGLTAFAARTPDAAAEVERRIDADIAWLDETFAIARDSSARGVVIALHANLRLDRTRGTRRGFDRFVDAIERNVAAFPGLVLLIHGDSHAQRVDHPLARANGQAYTNFTRLETFGSPRIGWIRVVVDTAAGTVIEYEKRLIR